MTTTETAPAQAGDTKVSPRLKTRYAAEIKPALHEQFAYPNVMQVP
ncbi:MAG: 50S ribosomal protein L5, partial [Actinomycetota bacterium]|nr:50S ribosomal protein L5 [Actinomycetota bacterium]